MNIKQAIFVILSGAFIISTSNVVFSNNKLIKSYYYKLVFQNENDVGEADLKPKPKCDLILKNATNFEIFIDNFTYPKLIPLRDNRTINFECMNEQRRSKVILFWDKFYAREDFYYGLGFKTPFLTHKCSVYNCELTNNRSRLDESDVVVVSYMNPIKNIPEKRKVEQEWIGVIIESPANISPDSHTNGLIHSMISFRRDSQFLSHYAYESELVWGLNAEFNETEDFLKKKPDFAAAIISNCHDKVNRLQYIEQMKKYAPVDVYGLCGIPCPNQFMNGTSAGWDNCKEVISERYKFYLAFENSFCKDYITEKFFIALRYNIIPVVMGIGDYHEHIPKSGFINVLDFKSPKELTDYLLYLSKNATAYNSYFKWKRFVKREPRGVIAHEICDICIKAHLNEDYGFNKETIKDIPNYWNGGNDCVNFRQYPQLMAV